MPQDPVYYELPDDTDIDMRRMVIALALFFGLLIGVMGLVFYHAQSIARWIPFSAEQRFVRPYEQLIAKLYVSDVEDDEINDYLQQLANALHESMNVASEIEIKVHYAESDEINAIALPGGHIIVFHGLLRFMPDENSLAMVLGHEIAHIANRDPIASLGRGIALQVLFSYFSGAGSGGETALELLGGSGIALFSREQEMEADITSLQGLNTHYGHVGGYRSFFESLQKIENPSFGGIRDKPDESVFADWLASHPGTSERLQYLDDEKNRLNAFVDETNTLPESIEAFIKLGNKDYE